MTTDKNKAADGILADIKYICKTFGSRNAGGEGEKLTAEYFTGELSGCADEVEKWLTSFPLSFRYCFSLWEFFPYSRNICFLSERSIRCMQKRLLRTSPQ